MISSFNPIGILISLVMLLAFFALIRYVILKIRE
jgi:hypothetical protein